MRHRHRPQRRLRHQFRLAAEHFSVLLALAVYLETERPKSTASVEGGMRREGIRQLRSILDDTPVQFMKDWGAAQQEGRLVARTHSRGGRET
jgi:hypothetical protein